MKTLKLLSFALIALMVASCSGEKKTSAIDSDDTAEETEEVSKVDKSKVEFYGTWDLYSCERIVDEKGEIVDGEEYYDDSYSYAFNEDGSVEYIVFGEVASKGTWKLEDNKLIVSDQEEVAEYEFEFLEDSKLQLIKTLSKTETTHEYFKYVYTRSSAE